MHNESGSSASGVPKGPAVVGLRYAAGGPSQSWLRRGHAANCEWVRQDQQDMQLISVNTGLPQEVTWHGRVVITAIYKQPVDGRVAVRKLNLDGDPQARLAHGHLWGKLHHRRLAGNLSPSWRPVLCRFRGGSGDAASPPLLQTRC